MSFTDNIREIKFRGILTAYNKFVYGDYWKNCANGETIINGDGTNMFHFCLIEEGSAGQFVGLYDCTNWKELTREEQKDFLKNKKQEDWKGREVFEGDIIKDKYGNIGEVYYKHGTLYIGEKSGCFNEKTSLNIKIIGNIYNVSNK